ncbi:hypothetical protein AAKU58_000470 [Oxalobacteraceae bacterium GrIS 1.18]
MSSPGGKFSNGTGVPKSHEDRENKLFLKNREGLAGKSSRLNSMQHGSAHDPIFTRR